MSEVPDSTEAKGPVLWSGQPLFWPKLSQRLAWAFLATIVGLALLWSVFFVHNPLDFGSFDQYCPPDAVDHRRCRKELIADSLAAILGIGAVAVGLLEILNLAARTLTGRAIETYEVDRKYLYVKRHSVFIPSVNLCSGLLSFSEQGRYLTVLGITELGLKRTVKLGPLEQLDQKTLIACTAPEKESL